LNPDTPIIIIDSDKTSITKPQGAKIIEEYPLKSFPSSLFDDLHDAQRVDFSDLGIIDMKDGEEDPLSQDYFEQIHRRPERHEKNLRNTDKGRAQHEKDQVIRLRDGLQGPDWLKIMGVSGITDSRKKEFEPARLHFLKGCNAIIEKFRTWKEEEKRRKLEKEAAMAEAAEAEAAAEAEVEIGEETEEVSSNADPPDYSDIDASAARQLHDEAIARSPPKRVKQKTQAAPVVPEIYELEKDFKSFFAKPHLREAALGKHRRSGRSVSAWGHPVPELPDTDFELPEEYRDDETLKAHARKKRRDRRVSKN